MTWRDVGDSLTTLIFDDNSVVIAPKPPDLSKISQVSTPPSRDFYPPYSPSYLKESNRNPNFHVNPMMEVANPNFSKLSLIEAFLENDVATTFIGSEASDL
jgi:hypothetical protein